MKEQRTVIQSGVSDQFKSFAAILIAAFALFQLFIAWFAHEVLPILDGTMLAVALAVVVYLWITNSVSLHSRAQYRECRSLLEALEFRLFESHPLRALSENSDAPWREDPELLAVGCERKISDSEIRSLRLFAS